MDARPQPLLGLERRETFLRPDPQRHGIGGLLRFTGGLPAEIALVVGMKADPVVAGSAHGGIDHPAKQRFGLGLQLFPAGLPADALTLCGADDQLTGPLEQDSFESLNGQQAVDQPAEEMVGSHPVGRR